MDSLDQYIQGVVTKEIYEPENYIRTIQNSLDTNDCHRKYFNLYKVAIIVICLLCTSGIAYATYNYVKNNFNRRKGIETAINNGYIMNIDGEPVTSNDVSLKINQILLDDYNLDISFGLEFKNMEIPDNVQAVEFENILIADENNNILYHSGSRNIFDNFVKSNNLDLEYKDYNEKYINTSSHTHITTENSNNINLIYNIFTYDKTFLKSKELNVYVENLIFKINNTNVRIDSGWNIKQDLTSSFQDRKSVKYISTTNNDENIISVSAITYTTGTNIKLEMKISNNEVDAKRLKELIEKSKNEQLLNTSPNTEKYNEIYIHKSEEELYVTDDNFHNLFNNIYIENSFGQKFYITDNISTNENFNITSNNKSIIYYNTFDMTAYNCTNTITLHFNYNSKEYSINLICSN